jgi:hypothetical protein
MITQKELNLGNVAHLISNLPIYVAILKKYKKITCCFLINGHFNDSS